MIPFPLALRRVKPTARATAAWFLPGNDAAGWIEEIAAWRVPMNTLHLYLTPSAPGSRTVGGLLVLTGALKIHPTSRAQGYRFVGEKLLVPRDAELDPPVHAPELARKLAGPLYWLHPTIGLVMFREDEVHRVRDLLEADPGDPRAWNRARARATRPPRLLSVAPEHEPPVDEMMRESAGDIGSEKPQDMPPEAEDQTEGGLAQAKKKAKEALDWLTGQAPPDKNGSGTPPPASEQSWIDRVQDWARKKIKGRDPSLRSERHKELDRLLKMLDEDPDRGLKYAIPLKGQGSRGLAEPGARLGQHTTDFDLSRLGGGGPSDSWDTPWEVQQRLREAYRTAALHALDLGRHRRAAYIYAELLGDFDSAASALKQGRHFREAAALFRDKLKKPLEAARCLEEGGLLVDAIAIYETLGQHMKVGDLYEQLERPEEAAAAFRRAVEGLVAGGDLVRAAHVLENRIRVPDEAVALLESGWPTASQAALCLREHYALLARLGRHDAAFKRTEKLRADGPPPAKLVVLVTTLSLVARTYPDVRVRAATADLTRVLAGHGLETGSASDAGALALAVGELNPSDVLLGRDVQRYLERRRKQPAATPPRTGSRAPVLASSHQLLYPGQYQWRAAVACGEHFYALGLHGTLKPTLLRGTWDGRFQHVQWSEGIAALPKIRLEPPQGTAASALLWLPGGPVLGPRVLAANDRLPLAVEAGTPSWLPEETIGLTRDDTDTAWALRREGNTDLMLAAYSARGSLLGTVALEAGAQTARVNLLGKQQGSRPAPGVPVPMAARGGHVFVALGDRLLHVFNRARCRPTEMLMDARELVLSPAYAPGGLAVLAVYASGASVFWPGPDGDRFAPQHLTDPRGPALATFTRGGQLVLITRSEGLIFDGPPGRLSVVARFPEPQEAPVALMPADKNDEFAVLSAGGELRIFRIPPA